MKLGEPKKNKTRGKTTCAKIYARLMHERDEVTFDMGQQLTKTKFILPPSCEKWVIQSARDAWKRFKGKLKRGHFVPYDNIEDMVKNRPLQ
ncbi:hypothetical protein PIB30_094782, partial [Stylosanthes scabra]|nr:hypothetical protein [Stylosanthes scabra]